MVEMKHKEVDADKIIFNIMHEYPENEWIANCRKALPDMDDISIMATIEILSGGDVYEV